MVLCFCVHFSKKLDFPVWFYRQTRIMDLARMTASRTSQQVQLRQTARGSHQSNGEVENFIGRVGGLFRTMREALETHYGPLDDSHFLLQWLSRHCAFLLTRLSVHDNGKTSYELLKAVPYQDQLMDYGEQVLAKMNRETNKGRSDWIQGFWLGRTSISTEHLIHTSQGIVKSRTVRRVPLQDRWTSVELQLSGFPPWSPTKEKEREGGWKRSLEGEFMPEGLPGPSQRQGNANSRKLQLFYNQCGRTPGCTSCLQGTFGRHHSRVCVERQ